ncbi:MAG: hypothetical protein PHP57_06370 [Sideroxydans sp.]|nr:hypothetical protein [Sideroxydans sp.]
MNTDLVKKLNEINESQSLLSDFEKSYVADNLERVGKFGDTTTFSDKQGALIERIYQERVIQKRQAKR